MGMMLVDGGWTPPSTLRAVSNTTPSVTRSVLGRTFARGLLYRLASYRQNRRPACPIPPTRVAVTTHAPPYTLLEMDVTDAKVGAHRHIDLVYL